VLRLAENGEGAPPALTPWVIRRVHGVDLSRRRADLPRWVEQLERTLHGMSRQAADARQTTREALDHLHRAHGPEPRIATDYLPTTLKVYLDLPDDWADPDDLAKGWRPIDLLREQLAVLERAVDDVHQSALADEAARVLANGTLLRDRFGLGGDLVSDVAEPPPALPEEPRVAAVFRALADGDGDGRVSLPELLHQLAPGDLPPAGGDDHPSPGTTSPVS
jgi:hypothetical protein